MIVQELLERGSGRTTRLINALPFRSLYLVQDESMVGIIQRWCKIQERDDVMVIGPRSYGALSGRPRSSVGVDHVVIEGRCLSQKMVDFLSYRDNIYVLDGVGLPVRLSGNEFAYGEN